MAMEKEKGGTKMKLFIASDIHGAAGFCREMLAAFDREDADRMLLLGDLLYHGPRNDLPEGYRPKEVIAMLNERKSRLLCVRGNCDTEVDQMVLDFPIMADYALLCQDGVSVLATHGHVFNTEHLPPLRPGEILLHGHTHVPAWEDHGDYLYFNPGSVSIPKKDSPRGYMIWEGKSFLWKRLDGSVYHAYTAE